MRPFPPQGMRSANPAGHPRRTMPSRLAATMGVEGTGLAPQAGRVVSRVRAVGPAGAAGGGRRMRPRERWTVRRRGVRAPGRLRDRGLDRRPAVPVSRPERVRAGRYRGGDRSLRPSSGRDGADPTFTSAR